MEDFKITNKDVFGVVTYELEGTKARLKHYLEMLGVKTSSESFIDLIDDIMLIRAMVEGKTYEGYQLDKNGYVINSFKIDGFTEKKLPKDFASGYYKKNNKGQFEIDYERKRQLEEV